MSKTIKNRFFCLLIAFAVAIGIMPCITASAVMYTQGGYSRVSSFAYVYDRNDESIILGEVWAGEGVTVLEPADNYKVYIEFNTLDGPKRGLVSASVLPSMGIVFNSAYGEINTTCSTYYAPNTLIYAGTVYSGESVAVLCVSNGWAYIEYNISNACRKRAYIRSSYVNTGSTLYEKGFYQDLVTGTDYRVSGSKDVYGGPNDISYPVIGNISAADNGYMKKYEYQNNSFINQNGQLMYYISYPDANGNTKYGYVIA